MQVVTTVGLDIAKSVFQVHGVDGAGQVVVRRQFKRRYVLAFFEKLPACLVGIEAFASSHHWSRELKAFGHTVKLMPPARACLAALGAQLRRLKEQILQFDRLIIAWHRSHEASKRLDAIPGVGPVLATALIASIADPKAFLAFTRAWLAAVPVRVISSPDRPNTRPPQRYRTTWPGA